MTYKKKELELLLAGGGCVEVPLASAGGQAIQVGGFRGGGCGGSDK